MFVVFKLFFFWCGVIGDKNIVSPSFILKMNNSRKNLKKFREINNNDNYNSIIARRNMYIVTWIFFNIIAARNLKKFFGFSSSYVSQKGS